MSFPPHQSVLSDQGKEDSVPTEVHCEEVEWFGEGDIKFTQIGAMYSALIALDKEGKLHQWCWYECEDEVRCAVIGW